MKKIGFIGICIFISILTLLSNSSIIERHRTDYSIATVNDDKNNYYIEKASFGDIHTTCEQPVTCYVSIKSLSYKLSHNKHKHLKNSASNNNTNYTGALHAFKDFALLSDLLPHLLSLSWLKRLNI